MSLQHAQRDKLEKARQEQLIHAACKRIVSAVHFHDAQGVYEYLARAINVLHCTD